MSIELRKGNAQPVSALIEQVAKSIAIDEVALRHYVSEHLETLLAHSTAKLIERHED